MTLKRVIRCRIKPYIQPFERRLAVAELETLSGGSVRPIELIPNTAEEFEVQSSTSSLATLASKLAYWEAVIDGSRHLTIQTLREATVNIARNGVALEEIQSRLPFREGDVPVPNRRCLRYGTHGIHEYRGKFFPQLVRALLNIARVPPGGVVADPMCGSGTTLVEGVLAGDNAIGLDANPLSVAISRTKCGLLRVGPGDLIDVYEHVRDALLDLRLGNRASSLIHFKKLDDRDRGYLHAWYSDQVLVDLDTIVQVISSTKEGALRDFLRISLSNILRKVSWQKSDDLRVRKEVRLDVEIDPIREFLEELGRSVRLLLAFLRQNEGTPVGSFQVIEGDARELQRYWEKWRGRADTVITSPPYATALPYIDTDRLSLCYLNLLTRPEHRKRDLLMVGNREVTERVRKEYWSFFLDHRNILPKSVVNLILHIERLNRQHEVGFRRHNLPALLSKYFFDMRQVLCGIFQLLKPGAEAFVVIGNNHTLAGGKRVEIGTAKLLGDIAETLGFKQGAPLAMQMLVSRDIFKRNAVGSESILRFRK